MSAEAWSALCRVYAQGMTEIDQLLKEAKPLRSLDDEHPDKAALAALIDRINALRNPPPRPLPPPAIDPEVEGVKARLGAVLPHRGPGRPRKVA
jgi:hypothetical protein